MINRNAFLRLLCSKVEKNEWNNEWFMDIIEYSKSYYYEYDKPWYDRSHKVTLERCPRKGPLDIIDNNIKKVNDFIEYLNDDQFQFSKLDYIYSDYKYDRFIWDSLSTIRVNFNDYNKFVDIFNDRIMQLKEQYELYYKNRDKNMHVEIKYSDSYTHIEPFDNFTDYLEIHYGVFENSSYYGSFKLLKIMTHDK